MTTTPATYWEPLWASGRRYRKITDRETALMEECLGLGHGRPALDIGCGDGALVRHLHHRLGYRATGIDCAPSALALAEARGAEAASDAAWRLMDFTGDDLGELPDTAYAVVTCRLVYRWIEDKPRFLDRVRRVLAPGGIFWVVTGLAERHGDTDPLKNLGITAADMERLTVGWSVVREVDLDRLRCYALRP
ncbi:class I SAM-dependent methyltransferase [Streptomyces sp. NPDC006551]|uniref:class I SAM-dependent methyltransferase n=1 Tax=Streptomyces sp. NPDC006551 TaxID=3157178 RepID=UPI0033B54962